MGQRRSPLGVEDLERLAARSWRGLEEERFGDWLLRAGGGFTGRANSALIVGDPPTDLPSAVAAVTDWYARRDLRPMAQVPLPGAEDADAAFAAAGWCTVEEVLVLIVDLGGRPEPAVRVDLAPEPDDAWLDGYRYRGTPLPPVAREILVNADAAGLRRRPARSRTGAPGGGRPRRRRRRLAGRHRRDRRRPVPAAWTGDRRDGRPERLGPRRTARARASCRSSSRNVPALALYARLGFTEHHRYHYRLGPEAPRPA